MFPEYIRRSVAAVVLHDNVVDDLVAATTVVDSLDYRSVQCEPVDSDKIVDSFITEGAFIPETNIKTNDKLTKLKKSGRSLVASYEAIKSQRLDLFAVMLRQIGNYINSCQLAQAVTALSYDGSGVVETQTKNEISYSDFISLYTELAPYEFNTLIAETNEFKKIINMSEFKDGTAGLDFHGTGRPITPLGAKLIHCKTNVLEGAIVVFDKKFALEKVQFGDIVTDYDKLIDRQIEKATVTSTVGFNRIVNRACVNLVPKI